MMDVLTMPEAAMVASVTVRDVKALPDQAGVIPIPRHPPARPGEPYKHGAATDPPAGPGDDGKTPN